MPFIDALNHLCKALNTEQWSDGEPAEAENDFWEIAAMEAYNHLMEWKSLQYCSTVYIDEASPPDLEKMWAEPLHQVYFSKHVQLCKSRYGRGSGPQEEKKMFQNKFFQVKILNQVQFYNDVKKIQQ